MTYGTAQDTTQYVTAAFIGWQYTIRNQRSYSTSMVSNNLQGHICIWVFVILNTSTFCSRFYDWENQICFKVCFAMLQYGSQSFKTGASIDIFMLQWLIGTVWHFIELSEHEVPNFKVTVTVTTRCTVRIITTMFRALVKEDFTIWTTWTFTDFPEVIFKACNVAFFYATIVVPCIICFLVIWIYSDI